MKFILFICVFLLATFSVIAAAQEDTNTTGTNQAGQSTATEDQNQAQTQPDATSGSSGSTGNTNSPSSSTTGSSTSGTSSSGSSTTGTSNTGTTGSGSNETTATGTSNTGSTTSGSGASGTMASASAITTPPSASDAAKLEVTKRGNAVATVRGRGNQQTKAFHLSAGDATFEVQLNWEQPDPSLARNTGEFTVVLVDQNNKPVDTVIATIDHFDGARTINVPSEGEYSVQVKAPGNWSVRIDQ